MLCQRLAETSDTQKVKIKIDATTVADQYIHYLTDLSLVNKARVKSERIIDEIWGQIPP